MGRIKDSLQQIIGKTIQSVVICQNPGEEPENQLFLVFKDGTSFEFWIDQNKFSMASKVDDEDLARVVHLAKQREGTKVRVVESPITRIGKERIESEPEALENNPLEGITLSEIDEEHVLFLAIHRRDALLYWMARPMDTAVEHQWVDLLSAAFGRLLQQCSFENMYCGCVPNPYWNSVVQPPSVLPAELMQFLGGLSIVNKTIYEHLKDRASIDAFLKYFDYRSFEEGKSQGRAILRHMETTNPDAGT